MEKRKYRLTIDVEVDHEDGADIVSQLEAAKIEIADWTNINAISVSCVIVGTDPIF